MLPAFFIFLRFFQKLPEKPRNLRSPHWKSKDAPATDTFPGEKAEQTEIAKVLSDMDAEIEALETKFKKYEMIKQGMMQELLTGKTRLI